MVPALVLLASWTTWLTFNRIIAIPFTTSVLVMLRAAAPLVFRRIRSSRAGLRPRNLDPARNAPEVEAAFKAVPPEQVAEILDGELFTFPRPGRPPTRSASRIGMKLGSAFDLGDGDPDGWVLLDEPELHLEPRPDKIGTRSRRVESGTNA